MFHDQFGAGGGPGAVAEGAENVATGGAVADPAGLVDNGEAARALFGVAALLEAQGANRYRVQAYRRAAVGMLRLPQGAFRYLDARGELTLPWLGKRLRRTLGHPPPPPPL